MVYPEPSMNDHGALWTEGEIEDENGDIHIICGCTRCKAARKRTWREEREIDDYDVLS